VVIKLRQTSIRCLPPRSALAQLRIWRQSTAICSARNVKALDHGREDACSSAQRTHEGKPIGIYWYYSLIDDISSGAWTNLKLGALIRRFASEILFWSCPSTFWL